MKTLIERLYSAAGRAGLLVDAEIDGQTVAVGFRSPDEMVLDGLALSSDYAMRYPAAWLPKLASGDHVVIADHVYQVRAIRSVGDGSERAAALTRL